MTRVLALIVAVQAIIIVGMTISFLLLQGKVETLQSVNAAQKRQIEALTSYAQLSSQVSNACQETVERFVEYLELAGSPLTSLNVGGAYARDDIW